MKTKGMFVIAGVSAALLLSGCDQIKKLTGGGKPSGQVVATVDGDEITGLELRSELGNFGTRDPELMKAAQQQALEQIVMRKLLVQEARKAKLDKTADYTLQLHRGEEALLAGLYQRKLASEVTQPSRQEGEAYVAAHPDMFANRRVLFVNQVIAAPNTIPPERLRPLQTLDAVRNLLDSEGVQYQENAVVLDTLSANPQLIALVNRMPANEIFVVPQQGSLIFNQVTGERSTPFRGEMATAYAVNLLRGQASQTTVGKKLENLRKSAESKVVYSDAYKPAKAPATKAAPATPTPAPAAK
jgi:EpsD family peptidyl-prolyl cis-trans isomerase